MNDPRQRIAEPLPRDLITVSDASVRRHPCRYDLCPDCGECKLHTSHRCKSCEIASHRPIDITDEFTFEGKKCRYISMTKGWYGVVDAEEFSKASKFIWHTSTAGYPYAWTQDNKKIRMHDLIVPPTDGLEVDHWNRCPWDNRKSNLRLGTHSQNGSNTIKRSHSMLDFKGIEKNHNRYMVRIRVNGKRIYCGTFDTQEEAAHVRDTVARHHFGGFSELNFSDHLRLPPPLPKGASNKLPATPAAPIQRRVARTPRS